MKNNLFNKSLLKKYAEKKAFDLTIPKHDFLKTHAEKVENNDFKAERSSYLYFYDFLKEIFGYDRDKNILFEDKEAIGRGKVEFVLKSDDKKFMVIELKDQSTDLDKPQNRANDKRTPVDQAFGYAQHSDPDNPIDWIMVSNFKEFRLYNYQKRSAKCICFTYKDLLNKEYFKDFMLSFSHKSHIDKKYPSKILKATLITEQKLESNFYQLFHETRLMLIKELEEVNNLSRTDAVHYAQIILNRYMFISFAEDTGLLKSQISTDTIITPIQKGNLRHNNIWQRLNDLFFYINEGNKYKKISAYNGGLFEEDLDFIKIRDTIEDQEIFKDIWQKWDFDKQEENIKNQLGSQIDVVNPIYKNLLIISSFDFSSELDVNILGHIFENSIGDLEELKADTKGRRKKEGIFYTPSYITDYICRNTIIPYLSKSGQVNTVDDLIGEYWGSAIEELDQKVKEIKIVDPACGSGAFLNKAADILVEIHQAIYEIIYKDLKETLKPYFDHIGQRREILLNNIYGVDLNEESVEITKLSLFLKVCRKDLKLPNLDNNIKCGNSLIDDPEYTDKPFNWKTEFPEIFAEGRFDIVIGNPPYVFTRGKSFTKAEKIYYSSTYGRKFKIDKKGLQRQSGKLNLFILFLEKSLDLLDNKRYLGFILPNNLLRTTTYDAARFSILKICKILKILDLSSGVFDNVTASTIILILNKEGNLELREKNKITIISDIIDLRNKKYNQYQVSQNHFIKNPSYAFNIYVTEELFRIFQKVRKKSVLLGDEVNNITAGIATPKGKTKFIADNKKTELYKKFIEGKNIKRYFIDYKGKFILYDREKLNRARSEEIFTSAEKILIQRISGGKRVITAAYDQEQYYTFNSINNLILKNNSNLSYKYLIAILNSTFLNCYYKLNFTNKSELTVNISNTFLEQLPIYPANKEEQIPFIKKVDQMLQLYKLRQEEIKAFQSWFITTFNIEKVSQKLEKYYELSFDEFLEEIKKKKVDVRSRKNQELLKEEYQKSVDIINPLLHEIEETDNEIDQMVYELYGLTEEEIQIVEESLAS